MWKERPRSGRSLTGTLVSLCFLGVFLFVAWVLNRKVFFRTMRKCLAESQQRVCLFLICFERRTTRLNNRMLLPKQFDSQSSRYLGNDDPLKDPRHPTGLDRSSSTSLPRWPDGRVRPRSRHRYAGRKCGYFPTGAVRENSARLLFEQSLNYFHSQLKVHDESHEKRLWIDTACPGLPFPFW